MNKKYSQEVYDYISSHVDGTPYSELAEIVNRELGTEFTHSSIRAYCSNHKLRNGLFQKKGIPRKLRIYTDEIIGFIQENYIGTSYSIMADMVNEKFGTSFTKAQMKCFYGNHHLNSGLTGRFEKGHPPANKGRKQSEYMTPESIERTKATRFKKGHTPQNHREVGSERINVDGYIEVKVAEPKTWKLKHRVVWEEAHGEIPKGTAIRFLDGNKLNCSIDNLISVTREEHLEITRRGFVSENPEITKAVIGIAKLNVAEKKREKKESEDESM